MGFLLLISLGFLFFGFLLIFFSPMVWIEGETKNIKRFRIKFFLVWFIMFILGITGAIISSKELKKQQVVWIDYNISKNYAIMTILK